MRHVDLAEVLLNKNILADLIAINEGIVDVELEDKVDKRSLCLAAHVGSTVICIRRQHAHRVH